MRFKYYLRGAGIGVIVATLILSVAFLLQDNISDEEVIRRAMKLGMVMEENLPGTLADLQQSGNSSVDLESGTDDTRLPDKDALNASGDTSADDQTGQTGTDQDAENPSDSDDESEGSKASEEDGSSDSDDESEGSKASEEDGSSDSDDESEGSKASEEDEKPTGSKPSEEDDKPEGSKGNSAEQSDEVVITIESGDVSRMVSAKVYEAGLVESADEFNSYLGAHDYDNKLQPGTHTIPKGASFRQIAQILTTR